MSLATSPAHDVAKLMGRRSISTIPKDQKSLLERKDSWAVDQDGRQGLATVPKQVLQTLKEAFIRLQGETEKEDPEEEREEEEEEEEEDDEEESAELPRPSAANDRGRQNGHVPGSTAVRPSSPPPSSPEVPISSWPASPDRSRGRVQDAMSDVDSPDETPASPAHMAVSEVLSQPLFHATPNPSALSEPEDLEMELPQAQETREAPINRVATVIRQAVASQEPASLVTSLPSTTDTPPCAQPQAATSSGTPKSSVVPADPAHGRSRRMKPIAFSEDNSPRAAEPAANPGPFTRRPSMRSLPGPNVQDAFSSSSDTPAPFEQERAQRNSSPPPPPPPPHNFTRNATSQHRTYGQLDGAISREISPSRQTPMHQLYRIQAAVNVSISDRVAPYRAFTATYPDYTTVHSGNLLSFIQACVYLRMLQEERRMREYLYDDFIRAWSSGFLPYVRNAGPGQEPLPALEWFNMLKGPILFNRMCVNAGNIDLVLNAYPEEASRIKAILDRSLQQPEESPESEPELLPGIEMELEPEPEPEPELEPQAERHHPRPPPPTREAPSLPAPSRAAPPPPPRPARPIMPSSTSSTTTSRPIPKPRKRSAEERARLKEHFRRKATSSSTSHIGSGLD
ncbi:hypothetical protein BBK36DRAFT_1120724 [Trichoderma citrinoviride]|uniref:Uncharacterized protein n=1 Tax=Trichoderma citrinoviride TaxID=58853 RepID=A0A2T4B9J2_9HYPO|nr:hypothetical protein BBK36DRAFT_1120724 [Trichoderma citrinoviride]PTB65996.1 hypothetical protein BBK36DRAFT_1120724 [Trichoderma citrinoviride]